MFYRKFLKPSLDFIVALIGFIILSPVFIIIVILLFIANGGKPFFFQPRPGLHEKIFKVIKFKTMNDKKDKRRMRTSILTEMSLPGNIRKL